MMIVHSLLLKGVKFYMIIAHIKVEEGHCMLKPCLLVSVASKSPESSELGKDYA